MPWYRVPCNMRERVLHVRATDTKSAEGALAELAQAWDGHPYPPADGVVHINFGRGRNTRAPAQCSVCGWISERLCDWKMPGGKDCDAPLCTWCTTSPSPEKDLCPRHALSAKAWLAGRTNTTDGIG